MPLYEFHVSVTLPSALSELLWLQWCRDEGYDAIRVLNVKGSHDVQNMMGKYSDCADHAEAIAKVKRLAERIRTEGGFTVCRVKAEAMMMSPASGHVRLDGTNGNYWEVHMKVPVASGEDLVRLCHLVAHKKHVALSTSARGRTGAPIVTIRRYEGTRDEVLAFKNELIAEIKSHGFKIGGKIQQELAVYDTNVEEDAGWFNE